MVLAVFRQRILNHIAIALLGIWLLAQSTPLDGSIYLFEPSLAYFIGAVIGYRCYWTEQNLDLSIPVIMFALGIASGVLIEDGGLYSGSSHILLNAGAVITGLSTSALLRVALEIHSRYRNFEQR